MSIILCGWLMTPILTGTIQTSCRYPHTKSPDTNITQWIISDAWYTPYKNTTLTVSKCTVPQTNIPNDLRKRPKLASCAIVCAISPLWSFLLYKSLMLNLILYSKQRAHHLSYSSSPGKLTKGRGGDECQSLSVTFTLRTSLLDVLGRPYMTSCKVF